MQHRLQHFKELFRLQGTDRVTKHSDTPVTVVGRVVSVIEDQFSPEYFMLETSHTRIKLSVDRIDGYWLFPGQIVAVTGTCDSACFYAQEIKSGILSPHKALSQSQSDDLSLSLQGQPLKVLCSRGPFTGNDDFEYKNLDALAQNVNAKRYHAVILLGPFVSVRHNSVRRGVCRGVKSSNDCTYEESFSMLLSYLETSFPSTQVILVPSLLDAFCDLPLPQPSTPHKQVQVLENPCTLTINGLQISIANYDILKEVLTQSCIRSSVPINKNAVAVSQLLEQQSLMPLMRGFPVDWHYARHFDLHYCPDLLILGSSLGHHFQEVSSTFCVFAKPCSERSVTFYDLTILSGLAPLPERIVARACSLKVNS
jgi:hypothetical protein